MNLTAYGKALTTVPSCKCLGGILMTLEKNWSEVVSNLRKAQKKWSCL